MRAQRGQVLPIWIVGILGTIALIVTALNYGNALRWHIRAQNAADSAAQAVLALQSERWNQMTELLYGMNVEEYRIRQLLNGTLLASTLSGGCFQNPAPKGSPKDVTLGCETTYEQLAPEYMKAVQRYSIEVALLHRVAINATYANWQNDASSLMEHLGDTHYCNNVNQLPYRADGGDCAFQYSWASKPSYRSASNLGALSTIDADGRYIIIPSYGKCNPEFPSCDPVKNPNGGKDTEDPTLFAPATVDVITCAVVPPLIPAFWGISTKPYYAIGRAAATNVMFVQDWFEPGALYNPAVGNGSQQFFQPPEYYQTGAVPTGQHDFYAVDFGGNPSVDNTTSDTFSVPFSYNEMSVRLGWWNSIPIHASGAPQTATYCPTAG